MNSATPDPVSRQGLPRPPGRKAIGITLAAGPGRLAALLIVGIPLVILVVIALKTAGGGGNSYDGLPPSGSIQPAVGTTPDSQTSGQGTGVVYSPTPASSAGGAVPTEAVSTTSSPSSPSPSVSSATSAADGPAATVQDAYNDIDSGNYRGAFSLGLAESGQSYAEFAAGYQNTASVTLTIVSVHGDTVAVQMMSVQADGTQDTYSGTYTVAGGRITHADIEQDS
jgi:hypothetical protein